MLRTGGQPRAGLPRCGIATACADRCRQMAARDAPCHSIRNRPRPERRSDDGQNDLETAMDHTNTGREEAAIWQSSASQQAGANARTGGDNPGGTNVVRCAPIAYSARPSFVLTMRSNGGRSLYYLRRVDSDGIRDDGLGAARSTRYTRLVVEPGVSKTSSPSGSRTVARVISPRGVNRVARRRGAEAESRKRLSAAATSTKTTAGRTRSSAARAAAQSGCHRQTR